MRNLVPNLVYAARGDEVSTVVIDGEIVVENGHVTRVDESAIMDRAQTLGTLIGAAAAEDFWRVSATAAQMMRNEQL
jgi:5-methylthioadenosine/S-adenosylhomocysteine deaminase